MIIVLIRMALRPGIDLDAFGALHQRMIDLVQTIPGFMSIKAYAAADGEEIAIACFESEEAVTAWRNHPEHIETRRRGRQEFLESYDIRVCSVIRAHESDRRPSGRAGVASG